MPDGSRRMPLASSILEHDHVATRKVTRLSITDRQCDLARLDGDELGDFIRFEIDELNSQLALIICHAPADFVDTIQNIQNELFNVGAELTMNEAMIKQEDVEGLEQSLDTLNNSLPPLKEFILPGGGLAASHCHVARSVCRRAERCLVSLNNKNKLNSHLLAYINRLSDFLFVLARAISKAEGKDEAYWQSGRLGE